ncbi:FUN14 family protein [Methanocaldococcus sp. FS406-22]|uniref:FUN14 domain-containing protein n=1 Tax=Methanocaldococcus sp. (strain FS406-22) TaxID=644281 RepID=UPI0001BF098B|nr:FUN14 domain-containing protein [Methanocaldococcus sp. FS406-22]ADC69131.1 FUN14 family protein [Methanocaldococcus sp. FS406-22]
MIILDFSQFLPDIGSGFVIGFVVGWAAKKAIKIVAFLIGIYILSLLYLAKIGVITINKEAFSALLGNLENSLLVFGDKIVGLVHSLSFGTSFLIGFGLGFKKG